MTKMSAAMRKQLLAHADYLNLDPEQRRGAGPDPISEFLDKHVKTRESDFRDAVRTLSTRARRTILRLQISTFEDLELALQDDGRLMSLVESTQDCGPVTTAELQRFVDTWKSRRPE